MTPTMYVDAYGLIDTAYLVFAEPINPCGEHPHDDDVYLIHCLLHVGRDAFVRILSYPSRRERDQALITILGLVQRWHQQVDEEEDATEKEY